MAPDPRLLEKLQALFAKEGAAGTTPEEVAAALGAAARLMERAGITREEVDLAGDEPRLDEEVLDRTPGEMTAQWKIYLISVLATKYGCSAICIPNFEKNATDVHLTGRPSDVQIVKYLFQVCKREIEAMGRRQMIFVFGGVEARNGFCVGCVEGIHYSIDLESKREREKMAQEAAGTSALVAIDRALVVREDDRLRAEEIAKQHGGEEHVADLTGDELAKEYGRHAGLDIYGKLKPREAAPKPEGPRRRIGS